MAIPVARVHLAMAHAALPGLLPFPPKCTMLPAPPRAAVILPNNSPPRPSRADVAERWDAHKTKLADAAEKWVSSNKKNAGAGGATSSSSSSDGRADSEERWDAHKKPASTMSSSSSSSSASRSKRRGGSSKRRPNSRRASSSSGERWDAHKNGPRAPRADELDDGESSTGSNDVELDKAAQPTTPVQRAFYAGPVFIASPEPSMLPMPPSFMICVA